MRVLRLHSSDAGTRQKLKEQLREQVLAGSEGGFHVVVTTYEMVKNTEFQSMLVQKAWWRLLVLDEVRTPRTLLHPFIHQGTHNTPEVSSHP